MPIDIFGTPGSVEVGERKQGEGRARRLAICKDALVTQPWEGIDTTCDVLTYGAKTYGTRNALGWRDVIDEIEEEKEVTKNVGGKEVKEKKKWKYFKLGPFQYYNFVQVQEIISEVARGLVEIGVGKDDVFNVYASTSVNWQLICQGCERISTRVATAYDSLGEEGLTHSLNEPECVGIFTHGDLLGTVAKAFPKVPSLRVVIYDGKPKPSIVEEIRNGREGMQVLSVDELRNIGKGRDLDSIKDRYPTPDTVALIMYTSGSTGAPKGVVITHSNLTATIGAIYKLLGHHLHTSDTYLAYLPLAHILEYVVERALYFVGMTTGYGRVKTLTDQSVRGCKGDIGEFAPSIMVGVPAVWEMIRKGITGKVNSGGTIKKSVFNAALTIKKNNLPGLTQVVDAAVLAQVRAATGGRLRLALSGGAALSQETQEFLSLALVTMLQGYGLTESCGMCAILPPEKMQYGASGLPSPAVEVKLLDVPDAGYSATADPPQGEICIRGNAVCKGYYKRPDLNDDPSIFTEDGWFRTGDVGQWNPDGTLTIIDRIKNLVKLQGGEYIALERLESTYKSCHLVSNICVHANTDAKQPIAIIIPHEANLRSALGDKSGNLSDLCTKDDVRALVMRECNAAGKKQGFKPMEMLEAVILTPEEWTPENGLVTAAQKVQRKKIAQKFDAEIKEIYKHQ